MGLESSNARMANLARQEMYFHEFITVDEIIARIDEVDAAQVQAMAQRLFDPARIAVTLLGRLDGVKLKREASPSYALPAGIAVRADGELTRRAHPSRCTPTARPLPATPPAFCTRAPFAAWPARPRSSPPAAIPPRTTFAAA
jgi:hypothetical protein